MQEGKVVFAVGQIAQVRIQSLVYDRFWCTNSGVAAGIEGFSARITDLIRASASYLRCRIAWDADPNTAKGPDIPAADSGNLRRATRAWAARDVRTNASCDGSTVAGWVARVIAGRAIYR